MNKRQRDTFEATFEVDFAYGVPGLGRFRVNVFRQRGTVAIAFRVIPDAIYSFEDLHLPAVLSKIADERRGLILATGVSGSGKSTTLAAMIDYINFSRPGHIITVEDPIEFLHRDKSCIVDQREVGSDAMDFASALRSALRQDPDVILVGEMRDTETIQTVLVAAETGHAVFSTLHTLDATETVQRVISVFPPHEQQLIRMQLASVLKGVIALRLLKRTDGAGRVPAVEVLVATDYIRDCIVNPEKTHLIRQAIAAGFSQYGMQTFDQSLFHLYSQGLISVQDALAQASKPDDFRLLISGIRPDLGLAAEGASFKAER
jgi:twitching motility protein PilT